MEANRIALAGTHIRLEPLEHSHAEGLVIAAAADRSSYQWSPVPQGRAQVVRTCFHTDARNARSRAALERIGASFEGVLRAHRLAADLTARDSVRFSIMAAEWPAVRERLSALLNASS